MMPCASVEIACPYCGWTLNVLLNPYDFDGNLKHQEGEIACPRCGFPLKFSTTEIEKRLGLIT